MSNEPLGVKSPEHRPTIIEVGESGQRAYVREKVWCLRDVCNDPFCTREHTCEHSVSLDAYCAKCAEKGLPI